MTERILRKPCREDQMIKILCKFSCNNFSSRHGGVSAWSDSQSLLSTKLRHLLSPRDPRAGQIVVNVFDGDELMLEMMMMMMIMIMMIFAVVVVVAIACCALDSSDYQEFRCIEDIQAGEEICHSYIGEQISII
eukprot:767033-Hanusia_phi.AAC.6